MSTRKAIAVTLSMVMVCISGCDCITIKPPVPQSADTSSSKKRTCTSCIEVCYPVDGLLVCEEECEEGHGCPVHEAKEAATQAPRGAAKGSASP